MKTMWTIAVAALVLFVCAAAACAGTIREYSAEQIIFNSKTGQTDYSGKVFVSGEKIRLDMRALKDGFNLSGIFLPDDQKIYLLDHNRKVYTELPMSSQRLPGNIPIPAGFVIVLKDDAREMGKETLGGYNTIKYEHKLTVMLLGKTEKVVSTQWMAEEFNLPLRSVIDTDDHVHEMRDIKIGSVLAGIFEIPSGYAKAGNPLEVFGSLIK